MPDPICSTKRILEKRHSDLSYNKEPFSSMSKMYCNTGLVKLEWDTEDNLWVGAHTKILAFLGFSIRSKRGSNPGASE